MKVKTLYNDKIIWQRITESANPLLENDIEKLLYERFFKIQDEQIKQALIDLGWTPPKDK